MWRETTGRISGYAMLSQEYREAPNSPRNFLPSGADNPSQATPFTDFAINYDTQFAATFPYLNTPNAGH